MDLALLVLSGCQALCQAKMIPFCQFVLILKPKNVSERGPETMRQHQASFLRCLGRDPGRHGPAKRRPNVCHYVHGGQVKGLLGIGVFWPSGMSWYF